MLHKRNLERLSVPIVSGFALVLAVLRMQQREQG